MTTYFRSNEIENLMPKLIDSYAEECLSAAEMDPDFIELIKHNFFAKYVFYNKEKKVVEIGINESKGASRSYPEIRVYRFPLNKVRTWMAQSYRYEKADLEFYGRLLAKNDRLANPEVVVE